MPSMAQPMGSGPPGPAIPGRALGHARGSAPRARGLALRRQAD